MSFSRRLIGSTRGEQRAASLLDRRWTLEHLGGRGWRLWPVGAAWKQEVIVCDASGTATDGRAFDGGLAGRPVRPGRVWRVGPWGAPPPKPGRRLPQPARQPPAGGGG